MQKIIPILIAILGLAACQPTKDSGCDPYPNYPAIQGGLRYDPQETDPANAAAFTAARAEAEKLCKMSSSTFGTYTCIDPKMHYILKKRYSILWKTPEELNPCVQID